MDDGHDELRVDRNALDVVSIHANDDAYWRSRTFAERLEAIEICRRIAYGYGDTPPPFQRVLEVIKR